MLPCILPISESTVSKYYGTGAFSSSKISFLYSPYQEVWVPNTWLNVSPSKSRGKGGISACNKRTFPISIFWLKRECSVNTNKATNLWYTHPISDLQIIRFHGNVSFLKCILFGYFLQDTCTHIIVLGFFVSIIVNTSEFPPHVHLWILKLDLVSELKGRWWYAYLEWSETNCQIKMRWYVYMVQCMFINKTNHKYRYM